MNKIRKKIKKIRLHQEGTHILITTAILLLIINMALYWGVECKWPFYIIALGSIILYLLMVNFFRCPIRLFNKDTEKIVVAPADGKIVVIEEVDEHEYFHDRRLMISIFMGITAVARRIVTYAEVGEECYIDEHMGFIKFGSRVDVYLPLGTEVCVRMGQKTVGNQTIIAKLK